MSRRLARRRRVTAVAVMAAADTVAAAGAAGTAAAATAAGVAVAAVVTIFAAGISAGDAISAAVASAVSAVSTSAHRCSGPGTTTITATRRTRTTITRRTRITTTPPRCMSSRRGRRLRRRHRSRSIYCPDTGYYPAVKTCPQGWLRVVPDDAASAVGAGIPAGQCASMRTSRSVPDSAPHASLRRPCISRTLACARSDG